MELVYERCCALDVPKKTIVACLILIINGQWHKQTRTFQTTTQGLLLVDWLSAAEYTRVAMESTGVYWRPIWNLQEGHFELLVVNRQHIKAVPGRDVRREVAKIIAPEGNEALREPAILVAVPWAAKWEDNNS